MLAEFTASHTALPKDLLDLRAWSDSQIETLLACAHEFKRAAKENRIPPLLDRRTAMMLFMGPSTRTRASLEAALTALGGHGQYIGGSSTRLTDGEALKDLAKVYSCLGDALCVRTDVDAQDYVYGEGDRNLQELASHSTVPVINLSGCSAHPTQGLADLMTLREHTKSTERHKFVILWAYSSYGRDLTSVQEDLLVMPRFGCDVTVCAPPGFTLDPQVQDWAAAYAHSSRCTVEYTSDRVAALDRATVIFPRNWRSHSIISSQKFESRRLEKAERDHYRDWRLTREDFELANPGCLLMHCLPAFRGEELDDEVLDGPNSVVFDQVRNKMYIMMAALHLLINGNKSV